MDVTSESPSLASERLRKAIERNRQKQQMRQGQRSNFSAPPRGGATMRGMPSSSPSTFNSTASERVAPSVNEEQQRSFDFSGEQPKFTSQSSTRRAASTSSSNVPVPVARKLVTRPEDIEFDPSSLRQRPAPKTRALVPAKKKARAATRGQSKFRDLAVKAAWVFCGILLVRLFFSGGGILDFYQGLQLLEAREYEYARISGENGELVQEIEQIQSDVSMQKKIVREHLGFIGSDEFLILFASENVALDK